MTDRTPIERLLASACPRDTNGDGDCGQFICPWCSTEERMRKRRFWFVRDIVKAMAEDIWGDTRISEHARAVFVKNWGDGLPRVADADGIRRMMVEETDFYKSLMEMLALNWGWEACVTDEWPGGPAEFLDEHLHYIRGSRHVDLIADLRDLAMMLDPDEGKYPGGKANVRPRAGVRA